MAGRIRSSFNGRIKEIPEIFVDNFEVVGKKAYFLSHCHEDHIQGLFTKKFLAYLKQSKTFIYMSEISASIIDVMSDGDYGTYIKPLKLGSTIITLKGDDSDDDGASDLYLKVSLIPAGHCFGSVMFLFRTPTKTILYTGDFRINPSDISKYNQLHENGQPIEIDVMYVDTTFQDKLHEEFPKRSETVDYAIDEMKKWLDDEFEEDRCIALHTSARFGYEFVYKEIFKRLKLRVYVKPAIRQFYWKFPEILNVITKDPESKVHLCTQRFANGDHRNCDIDKTFDKTFLYVHFSALRWNNCDVNEKMININQNKMDVCFATHCSRSELNAFVTYFAPKKIVGFREPYLIHLKGNHDFDDAFVESPPKKVVCKRDGVKKVPVDVLRKIFDD
ncbi:hypothetical protein K1T71_000680 [Dendrolimus kikuchii]|uniref:Uncharacterized protein n=1 Tax=Dendrolimus kikuchii TaxID=765133 RepID=A0ACC1DKQ4_9NEOP|nr:hypothetical protein K1T71_000680 [Dendrolimus kikuchii]